MSEAITPAAKADHTRTGQRRVACGGPVFGRHPRVWLTMVDDAKGHPSHVVCPYCSHVFEYDEKMAVYVSEHNFSIIFKIDLEMLEFSLYTIIPGRGVSNIKNIFVV